MTISMYQASVPVYVQYLNATARCSTRAPRSRNARKIDPAALLQARLYPDMHPLVKQVQIFTDQAMRGISRLAGTEPPPFPDTETTFSRTQGPHRKSHRACAELHSRTDRWQRGPRHRDEDAARRSDLQRPAISARLLAAELLLPRHHHLFDPAPCRRRARQDGFHGRTAAVKTHASGTLDRRRLIAGLCEPWAFSGCRRDHRAARPFISRCSRRSARA